MAARTVGAVGLAVAAAVVTAVVLAGTDGEAERSTPVAAGVDTGVVSRCVERFAARPHARDVDEGVLRRYAQSAYCEPFARRGWVHEDGSFRIAAYTESGSRQCVRATPGGSSEPIPCPPDPVLDCGLLDFVRRDEAQAYIARLGARLQARIRCDDGRPLEEVGAT